MVHTAMKKAAPISGTTPRTYSIGPVSVSGLSAVGRQLRDPIKSGLTRLTVNVNAVLESGRNLVTKLGPSAENEQGDAGRDGRTRLARPFFSPCSADSDQDRRPYPVDPYSAESADHSID